jgi:hypothetical protein
VRSGQGANEGIASNYANAGTKEIFMNLKQILKNVVVELENTQALLAAIQSILIETGSLDEDRIKRKFPALLLATQNRMAGLQHGISKLSDL